MVHSPLAHIYTKRHEAGFSILQTETQHDPLHSPEGDAKEIVGDTKETADFNYMMRMVNSVRSGQSGEGFWGGS